MDCPDCKGKGTTGETETPSGGIMQLGCMRCRGKGQIDACKDEETEGRKIPRKHTRRRKGEVDNEGQG